MNFLEKYKKQILIMIIFIGIPFIIAIIIGIFSKKDVNTAISDGDSKMPQVEIESTDTKALNEYIESLYKEYTSDGKSKFNYTYEINNDIISILVEIDKYDEGVYVKKYMGFNIDKKTGSYISDEELSNLYNYDLVFIKQKVDERLKIYYEEQKEENYIEPDCDYKCYLSYMRNMESVLDNTELVIQDNKLVAYINLNSDSFSNDQDYFENLKYNPYKIVIE